MSKTKKLGKCCAAECRKNAVVEEGGVPFCKEHAEFYHEDFADRKEQNECEVMSMAFEATDTDHAVIERSDPDMLTDLKDGLQAEIEKRAPNWGCALGTQSSGGEMLSWFIFDLYGRLVGRLDHDDFYWEVRK